MQILCSYDILLKVLRKTREANTYADDETGANLVFQERKHMEENNHMEVEK